MEIHTSVLSALFQAFILNDILYLLEYMSPIHQRVINLYVMSIFPHFYGVSRGWQQSSSYARPQPSVDFGSMVSFPLMKRTVRIGEPALYC